ncbi:Transcriptional regulator [Seminavis robusta]|uniref:Transcriptional regulator n=1 Tax=Seminavis robusta TaxID=568900 RepID=A0A9N8HD65_9STRA|nr:Transcriptional regulator [Seminavis robusta]|eukprot:Sro247_g098110.1 Transcriptional regulator (1065) ;mRNA; r:41921-45204
MSVEAKRLKLPIVPRREEEALLRKALQEAREGAVRVVLLGGKSGTGKSTLIRKTLGDLSNCWQAETKFDQRKSNAPLENLRGLLSQLIDAVMKAEGTMCPRVLKDTLDKRQYHVLRSFLTNAVTDDLLEEDSSEEFKSSDSDDEDSVVTQAAEVSKDALSVLTSTFKACVRSIAKLSTVVLTADDIHWSCPTSMQIFRSLLLDHTLENILICGTFRTEEDTATEGFYDWKEQLQDELTQSTPSATVQTVLLDDLTHLQVSELLADALSKDVETVKELSDLVYGFTHGNLFFMKHFLEKLQEDELLQFDMMMFQWKWSVEAIKRRSSLSDNVVQTLASRIHKLPQHVQNVLMLAACFGAHFDIRALEKARSALNVECVYHSIAQALEQEFVIKLNDTHYRFSHDMIQLTAYGLLPEDIEVAQVHWRIGSLLMNETELLNDDSTFFATVDHLNLGADGSDECITSCDYDKKCKLAKMNYRAGKKAVALSSFMPAARYLEAGVACLGDKPFECQRELAIKLYSCLATTEYVCGNIDEALAASKEVMENSTDCDEKIPMLVVMFDCYVAQGRVSDMLEYCYWKLDLLGIKFPRKPNSIYVQMEYQKMKSRLSAMSNEDILALPLISDWKKEIALEILYRMTMPLYQLEEQALCTLVAAQMIQITLKYGLSKNCAQGFVFAASFIAGQSHDIREAHRLGQLAAKCVDKFGVSTSSLSVTSMIPTITKWWLEPASNVLEDYLVAEKACMKRGLIGNAFQSTVGYSVNYFYTGLPLGPLLDDVEKHCNRYLEYNQVMFFFLASPLWQCLLNLTGRSENPASMEEGTVIEMRNKMYNHNNSGAQSIQSYQMVLSYYMGDLAKATEMADSLHKAKPGFMKAAFWYSCRRFFFGLIAIANYRRNGQWKYKAQADKELKYFRTVVKEGAINLVHKLQLLEAEMMSTNTCTLTGPTCETVLAKYDDAIVSASRAGFLQDAAFANYLCFQFIEQKQERMHMAELYVKRSFELWMSWGAMTVASSLADRHPKYFNSDSVRSSISSSMKTSLTSSGSGYRSRPRFDKNLSSQHKELNVM